MKSILGKLKRDRKGLSLVELIIAVAILAVLSLMLMGFMSSGAGAYRSIFSNISLQMKSQMALNQLQEYLVDCNGGICTVTDGTNCTSLTVLNSDTVPSGTSDTTTLTEYVFVFDAAARTITYTRKTAVVPLTGDLTWTTEADAEVLTDSVTGFTVTPSVSGGRISTETVAVTMEKLGRTTTGTQVISLRNSPLTKPSESDLIAAVRAASAA